MDCNLPKYSSLINVYPYKHLPYYIKQTKDCMLDCS